MTEEPLKQYFEELLEGEDVITLMRAQQAGKEEQQRFKRGIYKWKPMKAS